MRRIVILVAALAAAASLGLGASGAVAADRPPLADDVAARLGISADTLRGAVQDALAARIDAAVQAGRLTPEQGARLKERIESAKGLGIGARRRFAKHHKAFVRHIRAKAHGRGAAAAYLGLTREELRSELAGGTSLAELATEHGKTVEGLVDAMLAPAKARLDEAVAAKRLTQERADEILKRLTDAVNRAVRRERGD